MSRTMGSRKLVAGIAARFLWRPSDGYPASAPTLKVDWVPGTPTSYTLAPVRVADTVSALDRDRLTISGLTTLPSAAMRGLLAEYGGDAWLDGGAVYQGPVLVTGLESQTSPAGSAVLRLAEPLPDLPVTGTWKLRWQTHTATLPALDVGSVTKRSVAWLVDWTRTCGDDAPTSAQRDRGLIHTVLMPFSTGLTDRDLYQLVPGWASMVPSGQTSWEEQRILALDMMAKNISRRMTDNQEADDLLGEQFRYAHALLTASIVLRGQALLGYDGRADLAKEVADEAWAEVGRAMKRAEWADVNRNAKVDAGEANAAVCPTQGTALAPVAEDGYEQILETEIR